MKRLLSAVLSVAIILAMTTVSFAAVSFDDTTATTAALSFGGFTKLNVPAEDADSFTVDVIINTEELGGTVSAINLAFEANGVTITNISAQTAIGALGSIVGEGVEYSTGGDAVSADDFATVNNILATLTLQKTTDGDSATLSFVGEGTTFIGGDEIWVGDGFDSLTIKFESGEEEEEVFGIEETAKVLEGSEMMKDATGEEVEAAGDKVVAIFAKNVTNETLAAESYGIIFGGKRYPGILAVDPGKAWAVKLVGSAEQLPTGSSYEYGIFAEGCDDVMSATPWVID